MKKLLLMVVLTMMAFGAQAFRFSFEYTNDNYNANDLTVMFFTGEITSDGKILDTSNANFLYTMGNNSGRKYGPDWTDQQIENFFGVQSIWSVEDALGLILILNTPYTGSAVDLESYSGEYALLSAHVETTQWEDPLGEVYIYTGLVPDAGAEGGTGSGNQITWQTAGVPEPSTGLLFWVGAGLLMKRRKNA